MPRSDYFLIKCTGGGTAQLLALVDAIYLSIKFNKDFKIKYYPYSTGTFWNFEIQQLLLNHEIVDTGVTRGLNSTSFISGDFIADFPLRRSDFSYEKALQLLHRFKLDVVLRRFRGEIVVGGNRKNLEKVKRRTLSVSGNFIPLINKEVFIELSKRFDKAQISNPFNPIATNQDVVIHYRLGDMRKMPARGTHMGGHGVVDPETFKQILKLLEFDVDKLTVKLVSDEPDIGTQLLRDVGIKATTHSSTPSIWQDLESIASANIFIGSMSQFSFFGAMLCSYQGGKPYLPSKVYGAGDVQAELQIDEFNYFDYKYLPQDHYLFQTNL